MYIASRRKILHRLVFLQYLRLYIRNNPTEQQFEFSVNSQNVKISSSLRREAINDSTTVQECSSESCYFTSEASDANQGAIAIAAPTSNLFQFVASNSRCLPFTAGRSVRRSYLLFSTDIILYSSNTDGENLSETLPWPRSR